MPVFSLVEENIIALINQSSSVMKSCRVSICELPSTPTLSSRTATKYSSFIKKLTHNKHPTTSSSDSLSKYHLSSKENAFGHQRDHNIMFIPSAQKDEMFILLRGKNFSPLFENPSKHIERKVCRTEVCESLQVKSHIANQKRQDLRRKRVMKTIQRENSSRKESQRKFLKKTMAVELGLTIRNCFAL